MNQDFENFLKECATAMLQELADHFQSQIVDEVREYPRTTIRQEGAGVTGKIAGSPRDVVDTGALRDSYEVDISENNQGVEATYQWTAGHAAKVYMGENLPSGVEIPPYPWVHNAVNTMNWEDLVKRHFET